MNKEEKIAQIKQQVLEILSGVTPFNNPQTYHNSFIARRSIAGTNLPPYYLVYFLLGELLSFPNLGRDEKIAWSFPVTYKGREFFISHRKFGAGIFVLDEIKDEILASELLKLIIRSVSKAKDFFNLIAERAVKASELNVKNNSQELFARYEFLLELYEEQHKYYLANKGKTKTEKGKTEYGSYISYVPLDRPFQIKANHLVISCTEAFFSWTEHLYSSSHCCKWSC